ncbi:UNKNOWN [Stylonychia lemnae]|uniref:Uncharacterized protein n=1 Tax=Stylonychia lemnae TaxID=5949 RepID=A0A078AWB5_STYLE|nr:UNKNOWN [Stylonychia lemnae]|eukprot:CDW85093.1 UNKNOWN [Stylonychia lemnae]
MQTLLSFQPSAKIIQNNTMIQSDQNQQSLEKHQNMDVINRHEYFSNSKIVKIDFSNYPCYQRMFQQLKQKYLQTNSLDTCQDLFANKDLICDVEIQEALQNVQSDYQFEIQNDRNNQQDVDMEDLDPTFSQFSVIVESKASN